MTKRKILVIEDDRALSDILLYNLEQNGFQASVAYDGQSGLNSAVHDPPEIVLLDVMLPVLDGIEVCRKLRANPYTQNCIVVMLTAKSEEVDQLVGFTVGADDYVVKPFSVKVLLERIKAIRRRLHQPQDANAVFSAHGITVDRVRHQITVMGQRLDLTPSEFKLMETLLGQPGRAFDRKDLIDFALGEDAIVLERTIDVHIRSLRKKLGEYGELIETVRGVGYRFQEPAPS